MMVLESAQDSIRGYLRDNLNDMVQLTQQLCSFRTENPPGRDFKAITDFLADQLRSLGMTTRIVQVPDEYVRRFTPPESWEFPRYNVLARWDVGSCKTLHFNSHYDVVPVNDDWKTEPFSPVVKKDRLYGRGTSDMKGCMTSCLYAIKALRHCGMQPPWNVEISFTADEEIGGHCGTGYIIHEGLIQPDAAVICEGGAGETIMMGHRGVLWLDVLIQGVSAHGSNPGAGVNAFEKGMNLAHRFLEYHNHCLMRETLCAMDRCSARRPSMTLGGVSGGGTKVNTIPGDFHFTIDRRLIPEEHAKQVKNDFKEIVKKAMLDDNQLKAKLNVLTEFDAAITPIESRICEVAQNAVQQVLRKKGKLCVFGAFTDLHFFVNKAHCPSIGYGVEGDGIHGSQEYLTVRSLADTAQVYANIALAMES